MATKEIKWPEGDGSIALTYNGVGNGAITLLADANEGTDRSITLTVKAEGVAAKMVEVKQPGTYEPLIDSVDDPVVDSADSAVVVRKES